MKSGKKAQIAVQPEMMSAEENAAMRANLMSQLSSIKKEITQTKKIIKKDEEKLFHDALETINSIKVNKLAKNELHMAYELAISNCNKQIRPIENKGKENITENEKLLLALLKKELSELVEKMEKTPAYQEYNNALIKLDEISTKQQQNAQNNYDKEPTIKALHASEINLELQINKIDDYLKNANLTTEDTSIGEIARMNTSNTTRVFALLQQEGSELGDDIQSLISFTNQIQKSKEFPKEITYEPPVASVNEEEEVQEEQEKIRHEPGIST